MKFSEYIFDQNNRDTLTRDHLITAKTIKRCHRRRTDAREGLVALLIAAAFMGLYVAAQAWTKAGVEARFTPTQETNPDAEYQRAVHEGREVGR